MILFQALSDTDKIRSHESSIEIVQSTLDRFVCVQEKLEVVAVVAPSIDTSHTSTASLSVIVIVVSIIEVLSSFVGADIVTTGSTESITYD